MMKRKADTSEPEVSDLSPKRSKSLSGFSGDFVEEAPKAVETISVATCTGQDVLDITYIELQLPEAEDDEDSSEAIAKPVFRHAIKLEDPSEGSEYMISENASERLINLYAEADKRNPSEFGIAHIYEGYYHEGVFEVIENEILDYQKALADPKPTTSALFDIVEALTFFMTGEYDIPWMHEDGERCSALLRLIGVVCLDIITRLNKLAAAQRDAFKNLGLVVGFMILSNHMFPGDQEPWGNEILRIAKSWGLTLRGYGGVELKYKYRQEIADVYLVWNAEELADLDTEIKRYSVLTSNQMGGSSRDLSGITPEEVFAMNNPCVTDNTDEEEDEENYAPVGNEKGPLEEADVNAIVANDDCEAADSAYNAVMKSLMGFNPELPFNFKLPPSASRILSLNYSHDY